LYHKLSSVSVVISAVPVAWTSTFSGIDACKIILLTVLMFKLIQFSIIYEIINQNTP